jgi:signal transduction histidine kinase
MAPRSERSGVPRVLRVLTAGRRGSYDPPIVNMRQDDHERAVRLQLIADVGQRTTAILSPAELLPSALKVIRESFEYFLVNIFLVDGDAVVCRATTMPELEPYVGTLRLGIGREGIIGWVASHGEPLNVPDVRRDSRYHYTLDVELRTRSELAVPIILKGAVTGVLDVQSESEGAFTRLDVFTLQTVAGQLAVALENARLYEALQKELAVRRRTEKLLLALNDAGLAMQKAPSPDAVLVTVGEELEKAGLLCALHLASDTGQLTRAYASPGLGAGGPAPLQNSSAPAAFFAGAITAPLLFEDRLLGLLSVQSAELSADDVPAIQVFANEIAAAWKKSHLVRELQQSVTDLESAQEQLLQAQKMEAVGRLAGGVAHDFNNQLTAIMGYAAMLASSFDTEDPRRAEVAEILRASGRASDLTRQLLAFSRRQVLRLRIVDLNSLVSEMRGMLQRLIGEDVGLETYLSPFLLRVRADPAQIEQVIMNLAVNARDAMPEGGSLKIVTERVHLGIDAAGGGHGVPPGDYCVMRVADTGTGMSPDVLRRLFEPFFTTKEKGKGTGLGLSTAYGIVQQSGGHISCRSMPGQGTVFTIHLPSTDESPVEAAESTTPAPAAAAGETILVVEDDPSIREIVRRTLDREGYSVVTASTGSEGMELLALHPAIPLVITDLVLPGSVRGIDLARHVLTNARPTRLLCVSGYSEQLISGAESLLPDGAFLPKPFTPAELVARVKEILSAP